MFLCKKVAQRLTDKTTTDVKIERDNFRQFRRLNLSEHLHEITDVFELFFWSVWLFPHSAPTDSSTHWRSAPVNTTTLPGLNFYFLYFKCLLNSNLFGASDELKNFTPSALCQIKLGRVAQCPSSVCRMYSTFNALDICENAAGPRLCARCVKAEDSSPLLRGRIHQNHRGNSRVSPRRRHSVTDYVLLLGSRPLLLLTSPQLPKLHLHSAISVCSSIFIYQGQMLLSHCTTSFFFTAFHYK